MGPQVAKPWIVGDDRGHNRTLFDRAFEPVESLVAVAEAVVDSRDLDRWDPCPRRPFAQPV
jgi:hypothetical protein